MNSVNYISRCLFCILVLLLCSCADSENVYEITEIRIEPQPSSNIKPDASAAERFGFVSPPDGNSDSREQIPLPFEWQVPKGWQELPATSMRMVNLQVASKPNAECYLTILPGRGGGIIENINRWRNQMSLASLSVEEISKLPKKKLLGKNAVYIECNGTFVGISGDIKNDDYKLVGMILEESNVTVFVKMVGPKKVLEQEIKNYHDFCSSLQVISDKANSHDVSEKTSQEDTKAAGLSWDAPELWIQEPKRTMRIASFRTGADSQTECYISILEGSAGGIYQNINRWRGQVELSELDPAAIDNLPDIKMLGRTAKFVELKGNYTGMSGPTYNEYMMLGVVCPLPEQTLFVKMTGPESEVLNERKNFLAFCQSLKLL